MIKANKMICDIIPAFIVILFTIFTMCQIMTNAYAAMNVPVQVKCDSGIALKDTDTFTISYYNLDDDTQSLTSVEVSGTKAGNIPVEDGVYRIKNIKYNGTNEKIKESYGISGDFAAYAELNETVSVTLTIGSQSTKELEGAYDPQNASDEYTVIMDENHDENGQPKDGYIEGLDDDVIPDEDMNERSTVETGEDSDTSEDDLDELDKQILGEEGSSTTPSESDVVVEHYDNDNNTSLGTHIIWKLVPLFIIFTIIMIGVYIGYKKGKI